MELLDNFFKKQMGEKRYNEMKKRESTPEYRKKKLERLHKIIMTPKDSNLYLHESEEGYSHPFQQKKAPFEEPHKQKVKEIDDYMKKFEHDTIKYQHKRHSAYLESLKKLENMKSLIKSLRKNKYEHI